MITKMLLEGVAIWPAASLLEGSGCFLASEEMIVHKSLAPCSDDLRSDQARAALCIPLTGDIEEQRLALKSCITPSEHQAEPIHCFHSVLTGAAVVDCWRASSCGSKHS